MYYTAAWKQNNQYVSGLSPTISIYRISDDAVVVNAQAMAEIGSTGIYKYNFSGYDPDEDYFAKCDGGATLFDRYTIPACMFRDHYTAIDDVKTDTGNILTDTNELQTDWADGGRLDLILDAKSVLTAADIFSTVVEGSITFNEAVLLFLSILTGDYTLVDGIVTFRDTQDTKDRLIATLTAISRTINTRDGS
jgi:hypothetical protein